MSQGGEDSGEKTHEPSERKLEDARKRGDVPRSDEVTTVAVYLGLLVAVAAAGPATLTGMAEALSAFLSRADTLHPLRPGGRTAAGNVLSETLWSLLPIIALPMGFAVASLIAQRGIAPSGDKLKPKMSKISPLSQIKQKFGPTGLMDFLKRLVKLILISVIAFTILWSERNAIIGSARASAGAATVLLLDLAQHLLVAATIVAAAIAALDLAWVRFDHNRKLKMSLKELRDEAKESEGDPALKAKRRRRAIEIATNRMLADVPTADVVLMNPTHFAVALAWDRTPGSAPKCVAKGTDALAATIREMAEEAGVPVHRDAPTARALYATLEVGDEIRAEQYAAVAVAIRFAEDMRMRMRDWTGPQ